MSNFFPLKLQASGFARWAGYQWSFTYGAPINGLKKNMCKWGYFTLLIRAPQLHIYIIYKWFLGGPTLWKDTRKHCKLSQPLNFPCCDFYGKNTVPLRHASSQARGSVSFSNDSQIEQLAVWGPGSLGWKNQGWMLNMPGPRWKRNNICKPAFVCFHRQFFWEFTIPDINQHAL